MFMNDNCLEIVMIKNLPYTVQPLQFELEKPIFIVGAPRSGTNLLYRLLAQHSSLGWFSNHTVKKFLSPEFLRISQIRRRIFNLRKIYFPRYEYNEEFFSTIESPLEGGDLWNFAIKGDWNPKIMDRRLDYVKLTIIETLIEQNKKRFLSKFPRNSIRIPQLNSKFPDSKFIHIIRDGRAVINSMLERAKENPSGYFGIPLKNSENKKLNSIEKHASQWIEIINEIRSSANQLKKNQYLEVKYEDLINEPKLILNKITKFCELPTFNYSFIIYDKSSNSQNKNKSDNKFIALIKISNKNRHYKNEKKITKIISNTLSELNYK